MYLVMDPASGLLDAQVAPLLFVEEATARCITVDGLGQEHVPVLVLVVLILLRILDLVGEVWHYFKFQQKFKL